MFRDLIRDLINKISFYAFSKIYTEYEKVKLIVKYSAKHELKICDRSYFITMNFLCLHIIKIVIKSEKKKYYSKIYILIDDSRSQNFY